MKLVCWNVNGVRSACAYSPWCHKPKHEQLQSMLNHFNCDIICFQETKIDREKITSEILTIGGYYTFYSFCNTRGGYSGVSTYVRETNLNIKPINAQDGFSGLLKNNDKSNLITNTECCNKLLNEFNEKRIKELDNEGRCMITDHGYFLLFNIYFPNRGCTDLRYKFKCDYHKCIKIVIEYLINICKKHIIIAGDFNAKYDIIDSCDPGPTNEFYDRNETIWFNYLLNHKNGPNMIDTFKYIHPDFTKLKKKPYTCWDSYTFARSTNFGTRIDYIIVNKQMISGIHNTADDDDDDIDIQTLNKVVISNASVMQSILGSDHCPISLTMDGIPSQTINQQKQSLPKLESRYIPEFSGKQTKLSSFFYKKNAKNSKKENNNNNVINPRKRKYNALISTNTSSTSSSSSSLLISIPPKKKKRKVNNTKNTKNKTKNTLWGYVNKQKKENHDNKPIKPKPLLKKQTSASGSVSVSVSSSESALKWKNLFNSKKKEIPSCRHNEKCVLRTVTKKGLNRGKKFYACARGKGDKNDINAQCNYFEWVNKPSKLLNNRNKKKYKSW